MARLVTFIGRVWRRIKQEQNLRWSSLLTAASLLGCALPNSTASTVLPNGDTTPIEEWRTLAPGLEQRIYRPGGAHPFVSLFALRIDPVLYRFRAHYEPAVAHNLSDWEAILPDAVAFVNANFFDRENQILGLLVSDGVVYGRAYNDRGGLLQVQNGGVRVRSTITEPYAGEVLEQAVQAFPMLVTNGSASFSNTRGDRSSRRTIVGQDIQGRIVLMATSSLIGMPLTELSAYLPTTDLGLVNAVNLDGGGSTLMLVDASGDDAYRIFSFDPVPAVLAVYRRESS